MTYIQLYITTEIDWIDTIGYTMLYGVVRWCMGTTCNAGQKMHIDTTIDDTLPVRMVCMVIIYIYAYDRGEPYRFKREDVAVRCHKRDWFPRGVAWLRQCIATDRPSLNRDRGRYTLPAIYSQLLSSRDTSDLSDNWESRNDTEASVRWRRPDVIGRKLRTFWRLCAGVNV